MRCRSALPITLLATLAWAATAHAQLKPAERQVLDATAQTYRTMRTFLLSGRLELNLMSPRGPQSQKADFLVAAGGNGRLRDQVTGSGSTGMYVSNGQETIVYNGNANQYLRKPGGADSVLKQFPNKGIAAMIIDRYTTLTEGATDAHFMPDSVLVVGGVTHRVNALEVTYAPPKVLTPVREDPRQYWIDRETHMVLKARTSMHADVAQLGGRVDQVEVFAFDRAEVDPPLPDSLWAFDLPADAKQVDAFSETPADPAAMFTGKPAIDFTLKDLKGRPRSLKSLRGKTVLLDFWATWCGPCRITMPQVAKIHAQYKNRGVEVMSINVGEDAQKAGAYMTRNNYAFTTLLDEERTVATRYRVNGIPTLVVIDAQGTVSDYMVGVHDEAQLKAALKKAGVK